MLIKAAEYFAKYQTSLCVRDDEQVDAWLAQFSSATKKMEAVKENFRIREYGLGFPHQRWQYNGHVYTLDELVEKLKDLIKKEKEMELPAKPPVQSNHLERREVPIFGTPSAELEDLERERQERKERIGRSAAEIAAECNLKKEGSIFSQVQPPQRPKWSTLEGKMIDVLFRNQCNDDERSTQSRWCQGEVLMITSQNEDEARVTVKWNVIDFCILSKQRAKERELEIVSCNIEGFKWAVHGDHTLSDETRKKYGPILEIELKKRAEIEESMRNVSGEELTSEVVLRDDLFNKDKDDGWRLDFNLVVLDFDFDFGGKGSSKKETGSNYSGKDALSSVQELSSDED